MKEDIKGSKRAKRGTNPKVSETKLANEWNTERNPKSADKITTGSDYKAWWTCSVCDLDYDAVVHTRFRPKKPAACPYCAKKRASHFHNLQILYPLVASQFDEERNGVTPTEVTPGSRTVYWWSCSKGHSFQNKPLNMTQTDKETCRYCAYKDVWPGESLGDLFPDLCKEIDREAMTNFDEFSFPPGSQKKISWKCMKGHRWQASAYHRTAHEYGCRKCKMPYTRPEIRIFSELNQFVTDLRLRSRVNNIEVDILLPDERIAIEYDGVHWHQGKEKSDLKKNQKLEALNYTVIRVRQNMTQIGPYDIVSAGDLTIDDCKSLMKVMRSLVSDRALKKRLAGYLKLKSWSNDELYKKIFSEMPAPIYENSVAAKLSDRYASWDIAKNAPITAAMVSFGSNDEYWWKCPKGHSFEAPPNRVRKNTYTCPYCTNRKIDAGNSLAALHPKIAQEWDPKKNGKLKASDVAPNYAKKVWWKCSRAGHSYDATPNKRVGSGSGCPFCAGRKVTSAASVLVKHRKFFDRDITVFIGPRSKGLKIKRGNKKDLESALKNTGESSHMKVEISCKKCNAAINRELRNHISLFSKESSNLDICPKCR